MSDAMRAETIRIAGHGGNDIEAYLAVPDDGETHGSIVVIHHFPGYDEGTKEITRKFAAHGYQAICPNLYSRERAEPLAAAEAVREKGGVPDEQMVGDVGGGADHLRGLPGSNGKVAVIGYCSGGRHSFIAACNLQLDAAIDCYGAFIVREPPAALSMKARPVLHLAKDLSCPLLGLFGIEDQNPSPEEVGEIDAELTKLGKPHEFHIFDEAGHAFFATERPNYRVDAANKGWPIIWDFLGRTVD